MKTIHLVVNDITLAVQAKENESIVKFLKKIQAIPDFKETRLATYNEIDNFNKLI